MSEPARYVLWLSIEEQVPQENGDDDCNDVGLPEPIAVEFETLEAAEAYRGMLLDMLISTYIIHTYAPVYAKVEQLEKELNPFIYNLEGIDEPSACPGEGGPTDSTGDVGPGLPAEANRDTGVEETEGSDAGAVEDGASGDGDASEHAGEAACSLRSRARDSQK